MIDMGPFAVALLLFRKFDGVLEFQCTDEMKEKLKDTIQNNIPMATMSLKDTFGLVAMSGAPIGMFEPILQLISNKVAGEISISGVTSIGFKITIRVPGVDQAVSSLLENV